MQFLNTKDFYAQIYFTDLFWYKIPHEYSIILRLFQYCGLIQITIFGLKYYELYHILFVLAEDHRSA